jgi:phosphatidylglycerophosphate synthase
MFDHHLRPLIDRPLNRIARHLARAGISANMLTGAGLAVGLGAAFCICFGLFIPALALAAASRLLDGLDGAVARATAPGLLGGYYDILADFIFYAAVPAAFAIYNPGANALPATLLLAAFFVNAASFLGFAVLAEKHALTTSRNGEKSHYHSVGLVEGTETIIFFALILVMPNAFPIAAYTFATLTVYTVAARTYHAARVFR